MIPDMQPSSSIGREASLVLARRRRGRNLALLGVLVAVAVLFYLIAMVKFIAPLAVKS